MTEVKQQEDMNRFDIVECDAQAKCLGQTLEAHCFKQLVIFLFQRVEVYILILHI